MNQKNCDVFRGEFPDIKLINTAPTRNDAVLDLCYTNCDVTETSVSIPLWSREGVDSDHRVVQYCVDFTVPKFTYVKVKRRKITENAKRLFVEKMKTQNWERMLQADVNEKTRIFHNVIEGLKDEFFPYKVSKIRSDEDPWITDHIRRRIRARDEEFRTGGRGESWRKLKEEVRREMANSKSAYYEREVEKIENASNKRDLAYTALKNLNCPSRPKQWSVCDLFPDKSELETVEVLAEFFSSVSNENLPIQEKNIPVTYDRPTYDLTEEMIVKRIRESKKPNSSVPGDIPPNLINELSETIAYPVMLIFNSVPREGRWPELWRTEYQTVIPKVKRPTSVNELRNLSCTNFLSKVLESFVADAIKSEINLSELQYGGMKGCGTDNFLVEMWDTVLESMETEGNVVALMSVDFSKAFNRLNHQACLEKLAEKNASNQTISMIFSFLHDRRMCVRNGATTSSFRKVMGGSPQGTKLGNLLFCIAIDDITYDCQPYSQVSTTGTPPDSAIPPEYLPTITSTPSLNDSFQPNPYGLRKKLNVIDDTVDFDLLEPQEYKDAETWELGYVDDINVGETLKTVDGVSHFTVHKEKKSIRAKGCEKKYEVIKKNGKEVGMQINPLKTQLLCMSSSGSAEISSYVSIEGRRIESGLSLKVLGFVLGSRPTPTYHVDNLIGKFNRSLWSLVHLKRAKLNCNTLKRVYVSMLRPLLEYGSNVIYSMITQCDKDRLEACQRKALVIIYGFGYDYVDLLEQAQLQCLNKRREELFRKFCMKMSKSERFSRKWLPLREYEDDVRVLRRRKKYIEYNARTTRMYNSPVFEMRRILNSMCAGN